MVLLTRLVPLLVAPFTLLLVATQRSVAEQGLYFIFWNVQALTQLMEQGIGALIVQFASHESPSLGWNADGALTGDEHAVRRLAGVLRDGIAWYARVALALAVLGTTLGSWLLGTSDALVSPAPVIPWLVTIAFTAAYLPLVPLLCAVEGCGGLLPVQRMRLAQVITASIALWSVLPRWGALWAVAIYASVWITVPTLWLVRTHRGLIAQLRESTRAEESSRLPTEQWRTGVTWFAWWLAPQTLSPIVLWSHGAEAAGRVGMGLAIATAPLTLAGAFLAARYPQYGALLATGAARELARVARRATMQAVAVFASGIVGAVAVIWLIGRAYPNLGQRVLSPAGLAILGIGNLAWLLMYALGGYLRAWREERLMEAAVLGGLLVSGGTLVAAVRLGTMHTVAAHAMLVALVALPLAIRGARRSRPAHQHR